MEFPTYEDYDIFEIPKRKGGTRCIEAPNPKLKEKQRKHLLNTLYKKLIYSPFSHGYIRGRSIVTNALPHRNKKYILKMDIKNFFPSITWDMFKEMISRIYIISISKSIRNKRYHKYMMSPSEAEEFMEGCKIHFMKDKNGKIRLPQGGPGSPCISNFYLSQFDMLVGYRLCKNVSKKHKSDVYYTRYADDLTFSCNNKQLLRFMEGSVGNLLDKYYHLEINKEKSKLIPRNKYQIVCGILVNNERLELAPRYKRKIQLIQDKIKQGKKLTKHETGLMNYYNMLKIQDIIPPITWRTFDEKLKLSWMLNGEI